VPAGWRLGRADRADLPAFGFAPGDVVVAVGPDGLVANVAKYLDDQPVLGVDPAGPGVLARHRTADLPALLARLDVAVVEERATVVAELDDGQRLRGLNEIFVGDRGHQSARYRLRLPDGRGEAQSSSGVIVGTGTGATGWCAALARTTAHPPLPVPPSPPSPGSCARPARQRHRSHRGRLDGEERLELTVTSDALVVFSDGGEADRLTAVRGQRVTVGLASQRLRLVVPA